VGTTSALIVFAALVLVLELQAVRTAFQLHVVQIPVWFALHIMRVESQVVASAYRSQGSGFAVAVKRRGWLSAAGKLVLDLVSGASARKLEALQQIVCRALDIVPLQPSQVTASICVQISEVVRTCHRGGTRAARVVVAHLVSSAATTELELTHVHTGRTRHVLVLKEPSVTITMARQRGLVCRTRWCVLHTQSASRAISAFNAL
jgi:hypothetical protein